MNMDLCQLSYAKAVVLNQKQFASQGTLGNVWRLCGLPQLWRGLLVDRD